MRRNKNLNSKEKRRTNKHSPQFVERETNIPQSEKVKESAVIFPENSFQTDSDSPKHSVITKIRTPFHFITEIVLFTSNFSSFFSHLQPLCYHQVPRFIFFFYCNNSCSFYLQFLLVNVVKGFCFYVKKFLFFAFIHYVYCFVFVVEDD
jgi:hypothetical protein